VLLQPFCRDNSLPGDIVYKRIKYSKVPVNLLSSLLCKIA
jgi:hypothetical protein